MQKNLFSSLVTWLLEAGVGVEKVLFNPQRKKARMDKIDGWSSTLGGQAMLNH